MHIRLRCEVLESEHPPLARESYLVGNQDLSYVVRNKVRIAWGIISLHYLAHS